MQPEPRWRNLDFGKLFGFCLIKPLGILRVEGNGKAAAEIDDDAVSPAVIASRNSGWSLSQQSRRPKVRCLDFVLTVHHESCPTPRTDALF